MFSGDTLFRGSCGRTDFAGGDPKAMLASLDRLAALPGNYKVYPGHEGATELDYERRVNPFMTRRLSLSRRGAMKLIFRGHEDRYAVEQSLLAFFPEERPVYEPAEDGEDHALVTLSRSPRYNTAVTTITYHGRTARGISRTAVDPQLAEYEAERLRQKAVKLSFFKAAREITGITPSWGALTGIRPGKLASRMLEEGMTERQVDRVLRDTYFVSPERRRLCIETAEASRRAKAELKPEDISLYVGIPFCPTRCAYCSFVSQSVERTLGLVEPYLEVLHREITDAARMVQETGLHIKSFYMGGGTPTTLSADQMDRLLTHLNRSFDLSGCAEYCIEAGRPDTIDREKLQVLLDHGVDRISVNPQSLEDHVLTAIGRRHTARDVEEAMALATGMGFPHVNMDLIAGLPEDTPEGFRRTLDKCLSYGADNITVHTLPHFAGELHHPLGGGGGRDAGLRQRRPPAGGLPPLLPVPAKIYVRQL